ncbi:MAG TPA: hypothetical protein ENK29_00905 [Chromatiales bacterium]|nr:hypothetical protein [Chromatiales bacterium]
MNKVEFGVIKIFQFLMLLFFTFAVFFYYGSILMIALTLWQFLAAVFSFFGSFLSAIVSLAALGGILYYIAKIPGLVDALLSIGMEIIKMGYRTVCRFGEMAEKARGEIEASAPGTPSQEPSQEQAAAQTEAQGKSS